MPEAALLASPAGDFEPLITLVVHSVSSPITRQLYGAALREYLQWWAGQGRPGFTRAAVQAWRTELEGRGYAPSTINQRLAAVRKLAQEAAANGLLASEAAAGIAQVPGARINGERIGNWLTRDQAQQLINAPDPARLKGKRDRAVLGLLIGCGLRRGEAAALTFDHLQQREGRWLLADLRGKHGRVRSVPVPAWVKALVDSWTAAAGLASGRLLRAVNRHGKVNGTGMTPQAILDLVAAYAVHIGVPVKPHDLRRTCAKLCRGAGGELEQIQLLLGHASIQTTERYLGTRQDLVHAPNDAIRIRVG
jgi:integrase